MPPPPPALGLALPTPALAPRDDTGAALRWELRRNCALTPRQLVAAYGLLCALTLAVTSVTLLLGARLAPAFAGLELVVAGVALVLYARHACDREVLELVDRELRIERHCGGRVERHAFDVRQLRLHEGEGRDPLWRLQAGRERLDLGRHVALAQRRRAMLELRQALRRVQGAR